MLLNEHIKPAMNQRYKYTLAQIYVGKSAEIIFVDILCGKELSDYLHELLSLLKMGCVGRSSEFHPF